MSEHEALERRRLDRGLGFEVLIERLAGIIRKSGAEADLETLRASLDYSVFGYGLLDHLYKPPALAEIATPLACVVEFLKREDCKGELISTLAADFDRSAARLRLSALITDLESLRRAANWPYRLQRGRPPNHRLLFLVRALAEKWVIMTDKPFTQDWNDATKEPVSPGAQFVEAVVRYLDPKSLPALPKMLERVVKERRTSA